MKAGAGIDFGLGCFCCCILVKSIDINIDYSLCCQWIQILLREEITADPIQFWLLLNQAIPATTGATAQLGQRIRQLRQKKRLSLYPVLYCC